MSTKVYVAYKLKKSGDLWAFLRDTIKQGRKNVRAALVKLHHTYMADVDTKSPEYVEALGRYEGDEWLTQFRLANNFLRKEYRSQQTSMERNPFHFDVSLGIWENKGSLYIIPYCDMFMRNVLDFLKKNTRLEDFCYWNNTDEPKGMPRSVWKARGKVWDAIHDNGWENHLWIDVCSPSSYYQIDPYIEEVQKYTNKRKRNQAAKTAEARS